MLPHRCRTARRGADKHWKDVADRNGAGARAASSQATLVADEVQSSRSDLIFSTRAPLSTRWARHRPDPLRQRRPDADASGRRFSTQDTGIASSLSPGDDRPLDNGASACASGRPRLLRSSGRPGQLRAVEWPDREHRRAGTDRVPHGERSTGGRSRTFPRALASTQRHDLPVRRGCEHAVAASFGRCDGLAQGIPLGFESLDAAFKFKNATDPRQVDALLLAHALDVT